MPHVRVEEHNYIQMKNLSVPYIHANNGKDLNEISAKLDYIQNEPIHNTPWVEYSYKPKVSFAMAYGDYGLFLKFYVEENHVKAVYSKPNDPVYKDSCVELFFSYADEPEYYNFEFNCAGTCLLGFGKGRGNRTYLPEDVIRSISFQSTLKPATNTEAAIGWELTVAIPFSAFAYHHLDSLKGKQCRANLYKCGDDLPEPHYVAWNNITTETPDFHRPEFFGTIEFSS